MALIKCPECGREVSDRATVCPSCAYPIAEMKKNSVAMIKIPQYKQSVSNPNLFLAAVSSSKVVITSEDKTIWEGKPGQIARFEIDGPTEIRININCISKPLVDVVYPGCKYELVKDAGLHWWDHYFLSEVDSLVSGNGEMWI